MNLAPISTAPARSASRTSSTSSPPTSAAAEFALLRSIRTRDAGHLPGMTGIFIALGFPIGIRALAPLLNKRSQPSSVRAASDMVKSASGSPPKYATKKSNTSCTDSQPIRVGVGRAQWNNRRKSSRGRLLRRQNLQHHRADLPLSAGCVPSVGRTSTHSQISSSERGVGLHTRPNSSDSVSGAALSCMNPTRALHE